MLGFERDDLEVDLEVDVRFGSALGRSVPSPSLTSSWIAFAITRVGDDLEVGVEPC